jgi:hypothetical protein
MFYPLALHRTDMKWKKFLRDFFIMKTFFRGIEKVYFFFSKSLPTFGMCINEIKKSRAECFFLCEFKKTQFWLTNVKIQLKRLKSRLCCFFCFRDYLFLLNVPRMHMKWILCIVTECILLLKCFFLPGTNEEEVKNPFVIYSIMQVGRESDLQYE